MDRTMKVFLACALGAFVGALVALEVNGYFWWLGMLAGGLVGYFSYEFKNVIAAIPRAWRAATSWRPDVEWWRRFVWMWSYVFLFWTGICVPFGFLFGLAVMKEGQLSYFVTVTAFGVVIPALTGALAALLAAEHPTKLWAEHYASIREGGIRWNIISLLFWQLPRGFWWLIRHAPAGAGIAVSDISFVTVVVGRFFWAFFKLIHSDERLLCGLDAAIGAGVGYLAGNAALGALAGGLLGVINYELVSKRLLHLVPAKNG